MEKCNPERIGYLKQNTWKIEPVPGSGFAHWFDVTIIESVPDSFWNTKFHYLFFQHGTCWIIVA